MTDGDKEHIYNKLTFHLHHIISYLLIWCPKYSRKVLVDGIDERYNCFFAKKLLTELMVKAILWRGYRSYIQN